MSRSVTAALLFAATVTAAPSAQSTAIQAVRAAVAAGDLGQAEQIAREAMARQEGSGESLEALSWVARGALAAGRLDLADRVAQDTQSRAEALLPTRPLDLEPHLPIALGAAFEVQARVLEAGGGRTDAIRLLQRALDRYGNTSIHERLQKNVHLLSLTGSRAIPLDTNEFLGDHRSSIRDLQGHPQLLFFWAHWCSDCKAQGDSLARIKAEFGPKGLVVAAPTRRYGYIGAREEVSMAEERRHIETTRREFYPFLEDVPVPLAARNFRAYGISSTPTIVLVDGDGVVQLYHPGRMADAELYAAVRALF
ncbi:MAG: TlpA family protein disulfide reductase [Acidimicrobiia bacterium]|nr:TlpA family protein disulfide reductase [Acidimicrobiia bacterium]